PAGRPGLPLVVTRGAAFDTLAVGARAGGVEVQRSVGDLRPGGRGGDIEGHRRAGYRGHGDGIEAVGARGRAGPVVGVADVEPARADGGGERARIHHVLLLAIGD